MARCWFLLKLSLSGLLLIVGLLLIGVWMMLAMPGSSFSGKVPPLNAEEQALRERLRGHVDYLAGYIGERNTEHPGTLQQAAVYIREEFRDMGFAPRWREYYMDGGAEDDDSAFNSPFVNVEAELHGAGRADEILIIGAHYDTAWPAPGADDNASGVAALLEIARWFAEAQAHGETFARTIRFVAFPNEESPHYGTDRMGSKVYAEQAAQYDERIVGMFSLEMLGYYTNAPGSQRFPRLIQPFYPDRGNFIAFVANLHSRGLLHETISGFRDHATIASRGIAAPEFLVPDIRRSDHAMFWAQGFAAVMVTDTAGFRNPHYHRYSDTADTLDYDAMTRVVEGLRQAFAGLARAD